MLRSVIRKPVKQVKKVEQPEPENLPNHIAVIMDGNGRWATSRGKDRIDGHEAGAVRTRELIESCVRIGIPYLTVYAFSSHNWKRTVEETNGIMAIMIEKVKKEAANAMKNGVRFLINGDISTLPPDLADKLSGLERDSAANSKLIFTICISYGSRQEITSAVKAVCRDACAGKLDPEELTEERFRQYMPNPTIPDPDILIRTGGEQRLSDFMLWQLAFTELYITPVLWPDFSEKYLIEAITEYSRRDRRFGDSTSKKS